MNLVISLIGTRVYIFSVCEALLLHSNSCLMGVVTGWSFSSQTHNLPPPHAFLKKILLSLSFSPLLSPALSVSLLGMFVQLVNRPLLEYMSVVERSSVLLCCSVNPLCKCKRQKSSASGVFLYFPFKVSVLCILHIWSIFVTRKSEVFADEAAQMYFHPKPAQNQEAATGKRANICGLMWCERNSQCLWPHNLRWYWSVKSSNGLACCSLMFCPVTKQQPSPLWTSGRRAKCVTLSLHTCQ